MMNAQPVAMQYGTISPDGIRVAYGAVVPTGRPLYIWDSRLGTTDIVMPDCGCRPLSWTPDGTGLLVYRPDLHPQPIARLDLKTHSIIDILRSATDDLTAARVAPNGARVAFATQSGKLFVAPFRNSGLTPEEDWTQVSQNASGFFWSANGRRIYFGAPAREGTRILSEQFDRMDDPAGTPTEVARTDWNPAFNSVGGSHIVGGGSRIVGSTGSVSSDLWTASLKGRR